MASLLPFSLDLNNDKKKSALDLLRAPLITTPQSAQKSTGFGLTSTTKATAPSAKAGAANIATQSSSPAINRAMPIIQQRQQQVPFKPQTSANSMGANSAKITAPTIQTNAQATSNATQRAQQILKSLPAPYSPLKVAQKVQQAAQNNKQEGWRQYYDEEFKKQQKSQGFFERLLDNGSASRMAETNARNRYASDLLRRAYDDDGNVIDQNAANLAKVVTNENSQIAKAYSDAEKAKSRAIGASYDSDYYTGSKGEKQNALELFGKQLYATANAVRKMDVGSAILGADDTQKTDISDAGRFLTNLLPGMANAPTVGLTNLSEAISGKGTDSETGQHRELDGLERFGRAASGAIDVAGVFFGGTGDMLNSVSKALFSRGASEAAEQAAKQTTKSIIKSYFKAMLEEGAEEGVQQAFDFFGDGGKLITKDGEFDNEAFGQLLQEVAQSAALGAIGGGIFKGVGDISSAVAGNIRTSLSNRADGASLAQKVGGFYQGVVEGIQNTFDSVHNKLTEKVNSGSVDVATAERIETAIAKATSDIVVEQAQKINVIDNSTAENVKVNRVTPDDVKARVAQELNIEADNSISMDLLDEIWGKSDHATTTAKPKQTFNQAESNQRLNDFTDGKLPYTEYAKLQSDRLWDVFQDSNGGVETFLKGINDYNGDGSRADVSRQTISNNGALYRQLYDEYGRKPSHKLFNEALEDVLTNGEKSKYYNAFKEFDPEFGIYNAGSDDIDTMIAVREFASSSGYQDMMHRTELERQRDAQTPKGEVKSIDQLLDPTVGMGGNKFVTLLRGVSDRAKKIIKEATGIDTSGYNHVMNESAVRHALNRHGEAGELSITMADIKKARDVIAKADTIEYVGKNKQGLDVIRYTKQYDNRIVYLEEVRNGRRQLAMDTMYKQEISKQKTASPTNSQQQVATDSLRASSRSERLADNSVSQNSNVVNSKIVVSDGIKTRESLNGTVSTYQGKGEWNGKKVYDGLDGAGLPQNYKLMADPNAAPSNDYVAITNGNEQALIKLPQASEYDYERVGLATGTTRESLAQKGLVEATTSKSLLQNDDPASNINTDTYVKQQVAAQQKQSKPSILQRVSDTTAQLKHYLVDDSVAYEKYLTKGEKTVDTSGMGFLEKRKAKKDGTTTKMELREGVDRVRSSDMIARQFMEDNGLNEIGKMSDKALNTFQQYLIAKRAIELDEKGIKTGRNLEADQKLITAVGNGFAKQEKIIRDYNKSMLEYMTEKQLISPELKDKLLKENQNYVPFNRVMDTIEGQTGNQKSKQLANIGKQTVVQKIKGSDLTVDNPIESIMKNTIRMINEGERNDVAVKLASVDAFRENILAEGQKPSAGNDTLSFMVDGKKVSYEVPALVAKEMKNLNGVLPDGINGLVKVLGAPTRLLRTGATSANPMFTLSNLIRDQGQTLVTGNIKANLKGTPKAILATFGWGKKATELKTELSRNGIIGSEYRMTYGMKSGDLITELQKSNQLPKSAMDKLRHPIETLADVIGKTEYFTRAQQYFGTDGDVTAKSQAARNNTLNFSRGGSVVKVLNKVVPFLNAGVQGGRITVAQLKERPVRTTFALAATYGLACAVKGIGEQQNKELWDRLGDEEKEQNLVIFTKDTHYDPDSNRVEGVIKIPMPQMLYPILGTANNFEGKSEDLISLAGQIFTTITGIEAPDFTAETADGVISPVLNQLTPTFAKPFLEVGMNKNTYTGNEIVSEYDRNLNPEDKGKKYTTGLARTVAKITGIDAPVIDNFVSNWGGGLFQDLVKTMTDNPDNAKDGGGLGAMFGTGFTRRFLSGSITSQYEISEGLAKGYKKELKQSDVFKALSSEEQQKVLNAVDTDMTRIASTKAKLEQGREDEISKDLSDRQKSLLANGMDINEYISSVTTKSTGKKINIHESLNDTYQKTVLEKYQSMKSDEWEKYTYENKEAEYEYAEAKYQNDKANGELTDTEIVRKEKELRKLKVSKDYDKAVRDVYSLAGTKADIQAALNLAENDDERKAIVDELNKLNRAMYDAGVINSTTYKTRSRNINNITASKSSKKKSTSSEKTVKTPESGPGFTALLNAVKGAGTTDANKGSSSSKPTLKAANKRSNVIGNYVTKITKTNLGSAPKITKKKGD